jgi:hypothetical protein
MSLPVCRDCQGPAVIFFPGDAGEIVPGGIVVVRPKHGFGFCLKCGKNHGWPCQLGGEAQLDMRLDLLQPRKESSDGPRA